MRTNIKLTEKETKVLNEIKSCIENGIEPQPMDLHFIEGIKSRSISGILGSLVKKGLINAEEDGTTFRYTLITE